jgi:carboxyl-terminal processing protease
VPIRKAREHTQRENRVKVRWLPRFGVNFLGFVAFAGVVCGCAAEVGTIGALLGQKPDGRLFVRETPSGLAAARVGLAPGDEILLVEGKDVRQMGEHELYLALSGDVGTKVRLTVVRGDGVFRVSLTRTPVPQRSSPSNH